jgi:hypothetical protein
MRVRHRIPSIFNLSMVDVLCCALGCVILLWLVNLREAKEHEDTAAAQSRRSAELLETAQAERDRVYAQLREVEEKVKAVEEDRARVRGEVEKQTAAARELADKLRASAERVAALEEELKAAGGRVATLEDATRRDAAKLRELKAVAAAVPGLRDDLKAARKRYANEEAMAQALEKEVEQRARSAADLEKRLEELRTERVALKQDLDAKEKALAEARGYKDRWSASEERAQALERKFGRQLETLEEEKKALRAEASRYRAAADNRFAGITLTGRRVVFLVDTSGSMELVDENTPAPNKWPEVRQTLTRILRSLPDLEKFQVIAFAERPSYLLGSPDRWIDYDARTSPDKAAAALAAIKPNGGTNLYDAFEAAFRLRAQGLDTVYLLSDGLPNVGPGLRPEEEGRLGEVQRGNILGKHLRRTLQDNWNRPSRSQPRVKINAVGFFYESPDLGAFLWALARENDGSFVGMSRP